MKKLKIGIVGLGNVGRGVYEILKKDADLLRKRSGITLEIAAVCARSKKEFVDPKIKFYSDPLALVHDPEIEVIVEVIGGCGIAKNLIEAAIKNGKKIVTANKALIAQYGFELAQLVEKHQTSLAFEAAVAGAIPIIKTFKNGLASSEIKDFYGILNGTCNFILTKMQKENLEFSTALKKAQELGYAEADPSFDINGNDTAHKLMILAAIASATKPAFNKILVEGIEKITVHDIKLADNLGYKIKLLAIYNNQGECIEMAVYPALVNVSESISQVDEALNAIAINCSNAGPVFITGVGAGSIPTASAIVSDLVEIATNRKSEMFGVKSDYLTEVTIDKISKRVGQYFISLVSDSEVILERIFGEKIAIRQQSSFTKKDQFYYGVITDFQKESDIVDLLKSLDKESLAYKFLRVKTNS